MKIAISISRKHPPVVVVVGRNAQEKLPPPIPLGGHHPRYLTLRQLDAGVLSAPRPSVFHIFVFVNIHSPLIPPNNRPTPPPPPVNVEWTTAALVKDQPNSRNFSPPTTYSPTHPNSFHFQFHPRVFYSVCMCTRMQLWFTVTQSTRAQKSHVWNSAPLARTFPKGLYLSQRNFVCSLSLGSPSSESAAAELSLFMFVAVVLGRKVRVKVFASFKPGRHRSLTTNTSILAFKDESENNPRL